MTVQQPTDVLDGHPGIDAFLHQGLVKEMRRRPPYMGRHLAPARKTPAEVHVRLVPEDGAWASVVGQHDVQVSTVVQIVDHQPAAIAVKRAHLDAAGHAGDVIELARNKAACTVVRACGEAHRADLCRDGNNRRSSGRPLRGCWCGGTLPAWRLAAAGGVLAVRHQEITMSSRSRKLR